MPVDYLAKLRLPDISWPERMFVPEYASGTAITTGSDEREAYGEDNGGFHPTGDELAILEAAWNNACDLVKRSYSDTEQVRQALLNRLADLEHRRHCRRLNALQIEAMADAVKSQVQTHGRDASLSEHPPQHSAEWEPVRKYGSPDTIVGYRYRITADDPDVPGSSNEADQEDGQEQNGVLQAQLRGLTFISINLTWGAALDEVEAAFKARSGPDLLLENEYDVVRFRFSVLTNVLWEFETFGTAEQWKKIPTRELALVSQGSKTRHKVHLPLVIKLYKELRPREKSKDAAYRAVQQALMDRLSEGDVPSLSTIRDWIKAIKRIPGSSLG